MNLLFCSMRVPFFVVVKIILTEIFFLMDNSKNEGKFAKKVSIMYLLCGMLLYLELQLT